MNFTFTDEQRLFQRSVREYLEKACPPEAIRDLQPGEWSFERWKGLADLGVVGMTAPESLGGLGHDETELVLALEEAGRAVLPEPVAETTLVAIPALAGVGLDEVDEWSRRCVAGDALASAAPADDAIVIGFFGSDGSTHQVLSASAALGGAALPFDRGAFGAAAVLCGIAGRVIEMAATYAKERHQFGKPIGSFQAVKHLLADALLGLDFAKPAVYRAAWSLAHADPNVRRDVSMAKALASDAAFTACRSALQVHGAIGYTHEHDLHLWLTKGFALCNEWGTAAWHRERVATAVLDQ